MTTTVWDFTEYAENLVKDWPRLSERQQVRLHNIFNPGQHIREPVDLDLYEAEREALARHDEAKAVHDYVDGLLACEGCGRPPKAHGPGSTHQWTPTRDIIERAQEKP
jgi:hypothetical protein